MEFLKTADLTLNQGGYLVNTKGTPVFHQDFVNQQKEAHFIVTLAEATKGKKFKAEQVEDFNALYNRVQQEVNSSEAIEFVSLPTKPSQKTFDAYVADIKAWANFEEEKDNAKTINESLQKFDVLYKAEKFGLFFGEGVTTLKKLYSVSDIVNAVTILSKIKA